VLEDSAEIFGTEANYLVMAWTPQSILTFEDIFGRGFDFWWLLATFVVSASGETNINDLF
jgi:hypothetical protein